MENELAEQNRQVQEEAESDLAKVLGERAELNAGREEKEADEGQHATKAETALSTGQSSGDLLDMEPISDKNKREGTRQQKEGAEKERPIIDDTEEMGYIETSRELSNMTEEVEPDASHSKSASNKKQKR